MKLIAILISQTVPWKIRRPRTIIPAIFNVLFSIQVNQRPLATKEQAANKMYSRVCNSQNVLMQILKMRSLLEGKQDIFFIKNKNLNTINKEFNVRNNKTELSTMHRLTVKYRQFQRKLYCFLISSVSMECFFYFLGEGYSVNIRHMAAIRIKKKHIWAPVLRRSMRLRDQASLMEEPEEIINVGEKDMISMRTTITVLPFSENIFVILLGI